MISLVIPIFNEEELIDELVPRVIKALKSFTKEFEIILIDDGSTDSSLQKLISYQNKNKQLKVLALSKNFGHQAAFTAGLEFSSGEYVAMMDGDLQDPPELLAEMYSKLTEENFDIVSGKRTSRKGDTTKNLMTKAFHSIFKKVAGVDDIENAGNFSMMNRNAVNALISLKEKVRYLPGLRSFIGFRHGYIEYIREDRFQGKPKMSTQKLIGLASDAIFSFSNLPIRICLILGLIGTIVFMFAGFYVIIAKIFGFAIIGWPSTVLSIYFLGSIQLIFLGVVGEYVYRIYKESQKRPLYFIKKIYENKESE